jgi:hypothetical protein
MTSGDNRARRSTDDCFGHKRRDILGTQFVDFFLEFIGNPASVFLLAFVIALITVFEARRDVIPRHQQRCKVFAAPLVSTDGQRAQRIAMVTLTSRNKEVPVRRAAFNEVLS